MSSRGRAVCGAVATVALGAVSSAFINELHQGWPWWAASAVTVAASAAVTGWLAWRASGNERARNVLAPGAVKVGGSVRRDVRTSWAGPSSEAGPGTWAGPEAAGGLPPDGGDWLGPGAVLVERNVGGSVETGGSAPGHARTSR